MYPVCYYGGMINNISEKEEIRGTDIPITVGILLVDYEDKHGNSIIDTIINIKDNGVITERKNIIDKLNKDTGEWIDFYLPGYAQEDDLQEVFGTKKSTSIEIDGISGYYFCPSTYIEAVNELKRNLKININDGSYLILAEWEKGHFNMETYIINLKSGIKNYTYSKNNEVLKLFNLLIKISKKEVALQSFKKKLNAIKTGKIIVDTSCIAISEILKNITWSTIFNG